MSVLGAIGTGISRVGTALGLPDLGIGKALGGQAAPGALQGVNPLTYAGVGVNTPNPQNAAVLGAYTGPPTGAPVAQPQIPPSNGSVSSGSPQQSAQQAQNQALISSLLGNAGNQVSDINNLYNSIYGTGGNYDVGLQNSRNAIEAGYLPQFQNVGLQANQLAQQLDWQNIANGTGVSSIAGQQQQNLAGQAGNEAAGIYQQQQKDLNNLAQSAAKQKATDLSAQQTMNQQLQLLQQTSQNDPTGTAAYRIGEFINSLGQTRGTLAGNVAGNQPSGQLGAALNAAAPSQIYNPQNLQNTVQSISQSTLPNYLQNVLQQGVVNANTQNPGDYNYWLNYTKNLANPIAT